MITPDQISKSGSESAHQKALFCYLAVAQKHGFIIADEFAETGNINKNYISIALQELKWIHHIPNGGARDKISAANLKLEGVKSGVADLFWPLVSYSRESNIYSHGLYIEMKKPDEEPKTPTSKGGLSDSQIEFKEFVQDQGYDWHVCYSWQEAVETIKNYYHGNLI